MRLRFTKYSLFIFALVVMALTGLQSAQSLSNQTMPAVLSYYRGYIDSLKACNLQLERETATADSGRLRDLFDQGRNYFKKIEFIVEYYYPATAARINGAPLLEAEPSEKMEPQHPKGYQVLEEVIYGPINEDTRKEIAFEVSNLNFAINKLEGMLPDIELNESQVLEALKLNIYRMIIKGISGFDNPVALNSIAEARSTLEGTLAVLACFRESGAVQASCREAIRFIANNGYDFNSFDRAIFISKYINPLCVAMYDYQDQQRIPFSSQQTAIAARAKHLFEQNAFDVLYFAPDGTAPLTQQQVALGRKLFYDTRLSVNNNRSCGTCHQPGRAFTDGLKLNESLLGSKKLLRNTPTLLNAAFQPSQFYDSRITFLEDQAHDVISNEAEMGGKVQQIAAQLDRDKAYKKLFRAAYGNQAVSPDLVKKALAAYVRSLISMNSPFDRYMRGDASAMTPQQVKGFNLFMGKAKCGTCHFIPLFTGAVAPLYQKIESEVLGVPANTDTVHAVMDNDSGKYLLYEIPHQLYAFKTTTVRNTALTAPYMHNGVFATLEEVVDFYNRGGGAGLGFELPNQTLSPDRLDLSAQEQKDLIAFIHALTDTTATR
ncbi:cytochrome-c peroxidase [Taibaiella chishuiensis]|uniref:Cytochrome c peroxidase n=1 Tax=Taibaiella chishuiensis TaxID=1434707 RepID=A0A2P8CZC1_9BACT|nr:cytochrome c peroxidase [Taibaiella chishuiensis]PSK90287.1 cytochrome c peroxidase [Taibaiella chishuiensis]